MRIATAPHQFFAKPISTPNSGAAAVSGELRLSDFDEIAELGLGSGGTVSKVRHRLSSAMYALKTGHEGYPHMAAEAEILRRTDSPFIVRCHSVLRTAAGEVALLLELMDAGSLDSLLRRRHRFSEPALAEVAAQALAGLAYLHSRRIVHLDIKPGNLVANTNGDIKICDFGIAKILCHAVDDQRTFSVGTTAYMSPERFAVAKPSGGGCYDDAYAGDVWSLGITLLELFLGRCPILPAGEKPSWAKLMQAICFHEPPSLPEDTAASQEFRGFLAACLHKDPKNRASVTELLAHPFIAGRDVAASRRALRQLISESL